MKLLLRPEISPRSSGQQPEALSRLLRYESEPIMIDTRKVVSRFLLGIL